MLAGMITVSTKVIWSNEELKSRAILGGGSSSGFGQTLMLNNFLQEQGKKMVATVRQNIINLGQGGSSEWKPLSTDYALRKMAGLTPGKAKHGYPAILRDSGKRVAGITYVVVVNREFSLSLKVPDVLAYHFEGKGSNPKRSPIEEQHMSTFNKQFHRGLDDLLSGK
jgi:hypothetical protein